MRRKPIQARIREHYHSGINYHTLMQLVFPQEEYPKAWRFSHNGGPPGCAMAFMNAVRKMGGYRDAENNTIYIP